MRWCAHGITQTACGGGAMWRAPNGGSLRRRGSHDQIAVKQSAHAVPPTACADCSVRCADEPWGVERCHRATCAHVCRESEPFVTLLSEIEMQPPCGVILAKVVYLRMNQRHPQSRHTPHSVLTRARASFYTPAIYSLPLSCFEQCFSHSLDHCSPWSSAGRRDQPRTWSSNITEASAAFGRGRQHTPCRSAGLRRPLRRG